MKMAKRRADKELNHDNWNEEDDSPTEDLMGPFKRASEEELAKRKIRVARRRGPDTQESSGPSVFKNFAGFGNVGTDGTSKLSGFDFMSKSSTNSSVGGSSTFSPAAFKMPTSSAPSGESEVSFKSTSSSSSSTTASFSFGSNSTQSTSNKSNGIAESATKFTTGSSAADANNKTYLSNLKALNEGVSKWVQKHLDQNIYINLIPVFEDYKKHFKQLEEKYKPKFTKSTSSESANGDATEKQKNVFPNSPSKNKTDASPAKPDAKVNEASSTSSEVKSSFSFLDSKPATTTPSFLSPSSDKAKEIPTFSFGSSDSSKSSGTFSFGSSTSSKETFSFGGPTTGEKSGFSFGSTGGLTFGAKEGSTPATGGFSFGSGAPPFKFNPAPPTTTSSTTAGEDGDYTPPQPDVLEMKEENSVYDKKCKLFYKCDNNFIDKGVGTLFLKPVPDSKKTQLIVRAATSLGNVLLNIILNASLPTQRMGKNNVLIVCVPNPPIDPKADNKTPVSMLIRVKTSDDADELLKKIDEFKSQ